MEGWASEALFPTSQIASLAIASRRIAPHRLRSPSSPIGAGSLVADAGSRKPVILPVKPVIHPNEPVGLLALDPVVVYLRLHFVRAYRVARADLH